MIKNFIFFISGCFATLLLCGLVVINYSDYNSDALLGGWTNILSPHLEKTSLDYRSNQPIKLELSKEEFPKLQFLFIGKDGSIFLKGTDNKTVLFFYPVIDSEQLAWKCIATNKLDRVGNYICE